MGKSRFNSTIVGIDIGGTLAKLVIFIPDSYAAATQKYAELVGNTVGVIEPELELSVKGGKIHFLKFLSSQAHIGLKLARKHDILLPGQVVYGTGGGAHKYERAICQLGLTLHRLDEMGSLVNGLRAIIKREDACFILANNRFAGDVGSDRGKLLTAPVRVNLKRGFIVVNIGSGVSFLRVKGDTYERIGGSSLGGSSFLGLCALLTGVDNFDEAIDLAANGDSARVDMLVRDIYGDMEKNLFGTLRPTTLAASFGKMLDKKHRTAARKEDLVLSTLIMVGILPLDVGLVSNLCGVVFYECGGYGRLACQAVSSETDYVHGELSRDYLEATITKRDRER